MLLLLYSAMQVPPYESVFQELIQAPSPPVIEVAAPQL
jgi:hypothetical protein